MICRLLLLIALSTVVSGGRSKFRCVIECIPGLSCVMSHHDEPTQHPTQKAQRTLSQTKPDPEKPLHAQPNAISKPHRQDRLYTPNVKSRPQPQSRNLDEGMDQTTLPESSESGQTDAQSASLASLSRQQTSYAYFDQSLHLMSRQQTSYDDTDQTLGMSRSKQHRTAWGSSIDMTRSNSSQTVTAQPSSRNLTNLRNPLHPPTKHNQTAEEISGESTKELIRSHCRTIVALLPG
eukprot:231279_1